MPNEEIEFGEHEYRNQGGEIHRRPKEREGLPAVQAAWLVIPKEDREKELPPAVFAHFKQAENKAAVN